MVGTASDWHVPRVSGGDRRPPELPKAVRLRRWSGSAISLVVAVALTSKRMSLEAQPTSNRLGRVLMAGSHMPTPV